MTLPDQPKATSPLRAIRVHCLWCCKESQQEVKLCTAEECVLHPFRMGKNPFRKQKTLSEEQKQALANARERFNLSKSLQISEENELESIGGINSYPDMYLEEKALQNDEYPTYPDLPY